MSERTKSETSLQSVGFGPVHPATVDLANLPKPIEFCISKLEPEGGSPSGEYMFNCIAMVIFCDKHQKIALSFNDRSEATWLPFIVAPQNKTWNEATHDGIHIIFSKDDTEIDAKLAQEVTIKELACLHILRIQLPITQKFVYRLIQLVKLDQNKDKSKICCQDSKRVRWVALDSAKRGKVDKLWGPEVAIFSAFVNDLKQQEIFEFGLEQVHYFVWKGEEGSKKTAEEEMLLANGIGHQEVEKVYGDFLEHCFPAFFMTYTSFFSYMNELLPECNFKADESVVVQMFHGINYHRNGYLSFYEFLLGLVAMEEKTPNNAARLMFIFRYYDIDQDNILNLAEIGSILIELNIDPKSVRNQLSKHNDNLNIAAFQELVKNGTLPNCDRLCRFSVINRICQNFTNRTERRVSVSKRTDFGTAMLNQSHDNSNKRGLCLACRDKKYQFGTHCVRLDTNGRCVEPRQLPDYDIEENEAKSEEISAFKYSIDYVFSTVSIGHTFLDMIRDFSPTKGTSQRPIGFLAELRDLFMQYLTILCENVRNLFECEQKLIKINSPAYVIGDIRGNLDELLLMEKILWKEVPVVSNNFVFLGNYVNVGKWGIECVLFLFALKIVAPNKFFLIRGNNEIRSSQKNGLQQECTSKYGTKYGPMVWNMVNEVFDRMCLAVIIDESVLCVNTGLPTACPVVEDIVKVTADLKDPLVDPVAKDLLDSSKYSDDFTTEYLKRNQLSHMIRGNQFLEEGYRISCNGKCISVFSTSQYCNKKNQSAVVCVDHPKIRIVKLDTSSCQSSTSTSS